MYHIRSSTMCITAGTSTSRMTKASIRIAMPSASPNSLMMRSSPSRNERKTTDMISAAATTTRPIAPMPRVIAGRALAPFTYSSRMRLTRKTS